MVQLFALPDELFVAPLIGGFCVLVKSNKFSTRYGSRNSKSSIDGIKLFFSLVYAHGRDGMEFAVAIYTLWEGDEMKADYASLYT